jgi:hypothetical protein
VAALRVLSDAINTEARENRAVAESEFARMRTETGVKSMTVTLPDGTEVGTIAIKTGAREVVFDDDKVRAFAAETAPTEVVETINPAVLEDPTVLQFLREHRPDVFTTSVRPAFLKSLKPDDDGQVVNPGTGELVKVAEVAMAKPTGKFAYTPTKDAAARVVAAWRAGELGEIGGPLAPAVAPAQSVPEWPEPKGPEPARDEAPLPEFNPAPEGPFGHGPSEALFGDLLADDYAGGPF